MREYKAVSPEQTISKISGILENIGIRVKEIVYGKPSICNSVRLVISDSKFEDLDIGTNGKGMSENYALASAYGEMMERIENKMLFFYIKYASPKFRKERDEYKNLFPGKLSFRYFPDEEYIKISDDFLCEWGRKLLPGSPMFEETLPGVEYDMPFLPFYNVFSDKEEKLPYDLIRFAASTTGLCAGNTPEEAILQGINEIFERYVLQRIFLDQPAFPTIPHKNIAGREILKRFEELSIEKNWRFIIKDCSLGKGFPVIGLLIIDDAKGTYTFRLGSDTCKEIALQRCFTEIFQGTDINDSAFHSIDVSDSFDIGVEYEQNFLNGRGKFPSCIFLDREPFTTKHNIVDGNAISDNFNSTIAWLKKQGYELYIRDNSFLGFPAYHIYIPGLSDINSRLFNIRKYLLQDKDYYKLPLEFHADSLTSDEDKMFISKYSESKEENINLVEFSWSKYKSINKDLLLALVAFRSNELSVAYEAMDRFLRRQQKNGHKLDKYYYCLKDYFALLYKHTPEKEIMCILGTLYGKDITKEVINDCLFPNSFMSAFPLPKCFNCNKCVLKEECGYETLINIESRIQSFQLSNPIFQSRLRKLFQKLC